MARISPVHSPAQFLQDIGVKEDELLVNYGESNSYSSLPLGELDDAIVESSLHVRLALADGTSGMGQIITYNADGDSLAIRYISWDGILGYRIAVPALSLILFQNGVRMLATKSSHLRQAGVRGGSLRNNFTPTPLRTTPSRKEVAKAPSSEGAFISLL